jgi:hypothetical protein
MTSLTSTTKTKSASHITDESRPMDKMAFIHSTDRAKRSIPLAPDDGKYVTEEEYWTYWYETKPSYEWNNGYLEAKPMSNAIQYRLFRWFSAPPQPICRVDAATQS